MRRCRADWGARARIQPSTARDRLGDERLEGVLEEAERLLLHHQPRALLRLQPRRRGHEVVEQHREGHLRALSARVGRVAESPESLVALNAERRRRVGADSRKTCCPLLGPARTPRALLKGALRKGREAVEQHREGQPSVARCSARSPPTVQTC